MTLPGDWGCTSNLAYLRDIEWVLFGVHVERAAGGEVYLWEVAMPLYMPTEVLDLSWSERATGGSETYEFGSQRFVGALGDAASRVAARQLEAPLLLDPPGGADNVRMQEARGYGLVVAGELESAVEVFGRVLQYRARFAWEIEMLERVAAARELLEQGRDVELWARVQRFRDDALTSLGVAAE